MKLSVIGTGYVGLVAGTCFAESGNDVICVDIQQEVVEKLSRGEVHIFEPGLSELVRRNIDGARLSFTTDLQSAVARSDIVFIAVGTPSSEGGSTDLSQVLEVAAQIGDAIDGFTIVVNKSTVPVGTVEKVAKVLAERTSEPFAVASNPEFLKEGAAIDDFMKPDRVVLGTDDPAVARTLRELYAPFTRTGAPALVMDARSAEVTKYASNAMLASRISFMNEMARLCEFLGADINQVRQAVGLDRRIGPTFLFSGAGYGGSCFPKDIRALQRTADEIGCPIDLIPAIERVNERQKGLLVDKLIDFRRRTQGSKSLDGCRVAVWGLSFKPQTDDIREAPSLVIIERLLQLGAQVCAYDPEAMERTREQFGDRVEFAANNYSALENADAMLLVTEWNLFRNPDFERMKELMKRPVIFDGRNQYDPGEMAERGFHYFCIGRPCVSVS